MTSSQRSTEYYPPSRLKICVWILLSISFGFRIWLLFVRYFEADEMAHLNASFLISHNWLPYRDFFANHPPLLHFMLSPLFLLGEYPAIIFISRGIMFSLTVVLFFLIYRLARSLFTETTGWISIAWLAYIFMFFEKSLEVRPDIPGMIPFLGGIFLLSASGKKNIPQRWCWAGVLFSISILFSNTILFLLIGVVASLTYMLIGKIKEKEGVKEIIYRISLLLIGFLTPLVLCLIYFASRGALKEVIYYNSAIHRIWVCNRSPLMFLKRLACQNPFFFFWGIWGWVGAGINIFTGRKSGLRYLLIWFAGLTGIFGISLIPVPNPQYYLLLIPLFVIYAGNGILSLLHWMKEAKLPKSLLGASLLFFSGPILTLLVVHGLNFQEEQYWETAHIMLPVFASAALVVSLLLAGQNGGRREKFALFLLILLIIARPINFLSHYIQIRNGWQMDTIKIILEETDSGDRIMEGWPIMGLFRFPAYYYYYLPSMLLFSLTDEERGEKILKVLRQRKPKIITKSAYLNHLSPEVKEYIRDNYLDHPRNQFILINK